MSNDRNGSIPHERKRKRVLECNDHGTIAVSDDVGASDQSRKPPLELMEPRLEPRHKIFLSHSGAQKDFTWQLCEDLERVHHFPFFDKRDDSLPKGEKFYPLIEEAAEQCRVAVVVLSDEFFTRSKWPMMELNMFVKTQREGNPGLKILPLFLGITIDQFKEEDRRKRWLEEWKVMASEDQRINLKDWDGALSEILKATAVEYNGVGEGHVAFRKRVVAAVCNLLPAAVPLDVSHVQSMELLCEPILKKMMEVEPSGRYGVRVVGLYGMGGAGKTTISRAIYNRKFMELNGKACHLEFGSKDEKKLLRRLLQELTEASPDVVKKAVAEQLTVLLKERMRRQKVFLALDNVWDNQIEEAQMYLDAGYHTGSIVLVTGRSLHTLIQLGISECDCLEMPELEEDGATLAFLHYAGRSRESPINEDEREIIKRCVEQCRFLKGEVSVEMERTYHYLPLALRAFGSQFRRISHDIIRWKEGLKKLEANKADKFNMLKDKRHPVLSVLRLGYDALLAEEQHIFLDLVLFFCSKWRTRAGWKWLCAIHRKTLADMTESVYVLQRNGLIDQVREVDGSRVEPCDEVYYTEFNIHDLYIDFAEVEAQAGPFEGRRFLLEEGGTGVPCQLRKRPNSGVCWASLERLIIHNSKVQRLGEAVLNLCSNVEVLQLHKCEELEEVDVSGMGILRSIMVHGCEKLGKGLRGVESLSDLVILRCESNGLFRGYFPEFVRDLSSLTALQVLHLHGYVFPSEAYYHMFLENLSGCMNLQELSVLFCHLPGFPSNILSSPPDFGYLSMSLLKFCFYSSSGLVGRSPISTMSSLTNLQDLNLDGCEDVTDLAGLDKLISLQKLILRATGISELPDLSNLEQLQVLDVGYCDMLTCLPDLGNLKQLQVLDVSACYRMTSLVGITRATSLRRVDAACCDWLSELPDDLSGLVDLEIVDLSHCLHAIDCNLPEDYETLVGRGILNVKRSLILIVSLVEELPRPERSHIACARVPDLVSSCEETMESWIDTMRNVSHPAYALLMNAVLDNVYGGKYNVGLWRYLVNDGERVDVLIRALSEHYDRLGREWILELVDDLKRRVVEAEEPIEEPIEWWVVVATAPCTFGFVTKRAMFEPWSKTLLHYTLVTVLPMFLRINMRRSLSCANLGIITVLLLCKEKLVEARDLGIDPERCEEGMEFVDTFRRKIVDISNGVDICDDSVLNVVYEPTSRYCDLFPNYRFGPALATQDTAL